MEPSKITKINLRALSIDLGQFDTRDTGWGLGLLETGGSHNRGQAAAS